MNKSDIPATPTGLEQPRERTGATRMRAVLGKILGWGFVACAVVVGAFAARSMFLRIATSPPCRCRKTIRFTAQLAL